MKTQILKAKDNKDISIYIWDDVKNPKGAVQLVHGMSEHLKRYDEFANFLNENGYIVVGDDHRAHGETDKENLGKYKDNNLFYDTVSDEVEITELIKKTYNVPIVLFGHSYGSFLTQGYLAQNGGQDLAGVVLSGSSLNNSLSVAFGKSISKRRYKKGKKDQEGSIFAKLTFEKYDKKFVEGINSWLTRDIREVGKYNSDPLCGFVCSNAFYYSFFSALKDIGKQNFEKCKSDLKLLIIAGRDDKLNKNGKLIEKLADKFKRANITPQVNLFEQCRHEILNELNKQEVYEYVLEFINSCIV